MGARCRKGWILGVVGTLAACGDDGPTSPANVTLGETAFVFIVNPPVTDISDEELPRPGTLREGVAVYVQQGP